MPASALSRPRNGVTAALWVMLVLFILRVAGQFLIAVGLGDFLPPWGEWYSGLLPYPWLLASQIVIVLACGKVCLDFSRGRGFFVRLSRALGSGLVAFGSVYLLVMVIRYVMRMSLYSHERWMPTICKAAVTPTARAATAVSQRPNQLTTNPQTSFGTTH